MISCVACLHRCRVMGCCASHDLAAPQPGSTQFAPAADSWRSGEKYLGRRALLSSLGHWRSRTAGRPGAAGPAQDSRSAKSDAKTASERRYQWRTAERLSDLGRGDWGGGGWTLSASSATEERRQSVHEDRIKQMEMGIQKLTVGMENQATDIAKLVKVVGEQAKDRTRSKTPEQEGAYGGESRRYESPERGSKGYDSRERFRPRYTDQDRFVEDSYVTSLGRNQRDVYVQPGSNYSRPFNDQGYGNNYLNRGRPDERARGYANPRGAYGNPSSYNRGGSASRGRRYSPNQGRGFSPNQGRGSSPNSNQNRTPSGPQQNYLGQFGLQPGCHPEQARQAQGPPPSHFQSHAPPVDRYWQGDPPYGPGGSDRADSRPLPQPSAPSGSQYWGYEEPMPEEAYASQWDWRDPKNF